MPTTRPELSNKNKHWIPKARYYELKWFCLQYSGWKRMLKSIDISINTKSIITVRSVTNEHSDDTAQIAMLRKYLSDKISMIEQAAYSVAPELYKALIFGVTENVPYDILKLKMDVPCGKEMYYKKYREFFYVLDKMRK